MATPKIPHWIRETRAFDAAVAIARPNLYNLLRVGVRDSLARYDRLSLARKNQLAASLIGDALRFPTAYAYTLHHSTDSAATRGYSRELLTLIRAACDFALGRLDQAKVALASLFREFPTQFNLMRLYRIEVALGNEQSGIELLRAHSGAFPGDLELCLELAAALARTANIAGANETMASVRAHAALAEAQRSIEPFAAEVARAIDGKLMERPPDSDVYTDDFVRQVLTNYQFEFRNFSRYQDNSAWVMSQIGTAVSTLLSEHSAIDTVVDFGVFCGEPIFDLAQRHHCNFVGVDRGHVIREFNERHYQRPNLRFVEGNIVEVLPNVANRGTTALYHARTALLCYPEFIRQLYRACSKAGVRWIVLLEASSYSRWTQRFEAPGQMSDDAIPIRAPMMALNYHRLLTEAGYRIVEERQISPSYFLTSPRAVGENQILLRAELK